MVCYIRAGEWLKYTVNVQSTTLYDVSFRVSSPQSGTTMNLQVDGSTVSVPRLLTTLLKRPTLVAELWRLARPENQGNPNRQSTLDA